MSFIASATAGSAMSLPAVPCVESSFAATFARWDDSFFRSARNSFEKLPFETSCPSSPFPDLRSFEKDASPSAVACRDPTIAKNFFFASGSERSAGTRPSPVATPFSTFPRIRLSEADADASSPRTPSAAFSSFRRRPTRPFPWRTSFMSPFMLSSVWRSERERAWPFSDSEVISPRNPSPFSVRPRMFLSDFEMATTLSTRSPEPARIFSSSAPRNDMISWSGSRSGLSLEPGVTSRYLSPRRPIVLISARLSVLTRCWYFFSMSK